MYINETPIRPTKMQFIGFTRADWTERINWLSNSKQYNPHQAWNSYLSHPVILLHKSTYIDNRSRRNQKKILITIQEIN